MAKRGPKPRHRMSTREILERRIQSLQASLTRLEDVPGWKGMKWFVGQVKHFRKELKVAEASLKELERREQSA